MCSSDLVEKQVTIIYAATNGFLDNVAVDKLRQFEDGLYTFLETRKASLLAAIADKKTLDDEIKAQLNDALTEYGKQFAAGAAAA
mgnify:FL=1